MTLLAATVHVIPALIRRYDEAVASGAPSVTNWGSGNPRREYLHVDDMADACLHLLDHYDGPERFNVGSGTDVTIREMAETIASVVDFPRKNHWNVTKRHGTPQKLLEVSKLAEAGWTANISLQDGGGVVSRPYRRTAWLAPLSAALFPQSAMR